MCNGYIPPDISIFFIYCDGEKDNKNNNQNNKRNVTYDVVTNENKNKEF